MSNSELQNLFIKCGHGGSRANTGGARDGSGPKRRLQCERVYPPKPQVHGPHWYCVRTGYEMERVASAEIGLVPDSDFEVFAPMVITLSRSALVAGERAPLESLFERYLFVRFDRANPHWHAIRRLRGVEGLVGVGLMPTIMPELAMALIRDEVELNDCRYADELPPTLGPPPPRFAPGLEVRLTSGQFAGLSGIVQRSRGERVRILMQVLGGGVPVDVLQADVEDV